MTIYGLSTGQGRSGIAIIRVSGKEAGNVIKSLTGMKLPVPKLATLRKINYINTSELIDEGIILCMAERPPLQSFIEGPSTVF